MSIFSFFKHNNSDYESMLFENNYVSKIEFSIDLLVIADTHGELKYNKSYINLLKKSKYDLCCILGDVTDLDYEIILKYIPIDKIVGLLGNHDRFDILDKYGIKNISGNVIHINGVSIAGIEGCFKYKNENYPSFTHESSIRFLEGLPKVDILLSHDKPYTKDNNDKVHDGLKGITKYLYDNKVPVNIHGHIHKNYEDKLKNGTIEKSVYGVELIKIQMDDEIYL